MSGMYSREVCDGITEERNKQSNQEDETSKKTLMKQELNKTTQQYLVATAV